MYWAYLADRFHGPNRLKGPTLSTYLQPSYKCHLDWGPQAASKAAKRGDIIVIVDVLSFSTAVAVAIERGGKVRPCLESDNASELARISDGVAAVPRSDAGPSGPYSLSPLTLLALEPQAVVVLPSLNGGSCCEAAREGLGSAVISGSLVNAGAVAEAVADMHRTRSRSVTVVACGEQDTSDGNRIRMALEDYLGAGAILKKLPFAKSPEARVCQEAFTASACRLEEIMLECESGRELREAGFTEDVKFAARLDLYRSVPRLNGRLFSRL